MGTTVATNALLEDDFGGLGFITTAGFRGLLEIGRQSVPDSYGNSYFWVKPDRIVPLHLVQEVSERPASPGPPTHQELYISNCLSCTSCARLLLLAITSSIRLKSYRHLVMSKHHSFSTDINFLFLLSGKQIFCCSKIALA
jgi:hypothetical protein